MKTISLVFIFFISLQYVCGQYVVISGSVAEHKKPAQGVLVMIFSKKQPVKAVISDEKGQYRIRTDVNSIDLVFYKKGKTVLGQSYRNKLMVVDQFFNYDVEMEDTAVEAAQNAMRYLKSIHVDSTYLDSIFTSENEKQKAEIKVKPLSHKEMAKAAKEEQKRFANYKSSTTKKTDGAHTDQVTVTKIGPDTYEKTVNEKNEKKYAKNDKPISETTYYFETTRRYGVNKKTKKVEHFDKYDPMDHVKK
jgi:hypothetical protein